jgi:oligo-1,6-glucosidase
MVFQFEHMMLDADPQRMSKWFRRPWQLGELKQVMTRWQKALQGAGWNSLYLSNHDQPRALSRFGDDGRYRRESATMLATFLHMLQGTPYIYQGEEIGMTNVAFPSIADYRDIETLNMYRELIDEHGLDADAALAIIHPASRDNARTPMQWDDSDNAGFTTGTPWIGVNPNYREINATQAQADPQSIFAYYQQLIRLRKANPIMVYGTYDLILDDHQQVYAFTRSQAAERLVVLLNFTDQTAAVELPADLGVDAAEVLIANYADVAAPNTRSLTLQPFEARVYRQKAATT